MSVERVTRQMFTATAQMDLALRESQRPGSFEMF
jgi:hypothetical protein